MQTMQADKTRQKKIELIKDFLDRNISLSEAARRAADEFPTSETVFYLKGHDAYRISSMNHFVTKEEIDKKLVGAKTVFYLPDNNRDRRLSI